MHRPALITVLVAGCALVLGAVLTGCLPVQRTQTAHPFVGHELTAASAPAAARSPFLLFDASGNFVGRWGCQDVSGHYSVAGRALHTTDVARSGAVNCANGTSLSPFTSILSQPTLVVERDDGAGFAVVSAIGRIALEVGAGLTRGLGTTTDWTLAAGTDGAGTFSGYPATALRITIGDGRLHSFDGCEWVSTFYEGTGVGGGFQIVPTVAYGNDVQNCPDPTPNVSRARFARILAATTTAEHSRRLLVLQGGAGSLVFELPPARS